ncbi:alpha-galactosidase [Agromyces sp. H3Y2-19a]|uniref:alpha-galactosidase n=1 Tax=Agromyces chromiiresistens TaxID=3030835 RepID=UPI0023B959B0|nr:alpha-galactosidase [Agromyces chromiiresistens]MDF0514342.1 alpha-galactosidase [Agromyces chromiiresistens]
MTVVSDFGLLLRSGGVALALDVRGGGLPTVVHWGPDLGDLDAVGFGALADAGIASVAASEVDEPVQLSLLPEHSRGWLGQPGISGSRDGSAWSPRFTTTGARLDGRRLDVLADTGIASPAEARASGRTLVSCGAGRVVFEASDRVAGLGLELTVELTESGVVRCRAVLENLEPTPYRLDELLLCLPVPPFAAETLDFAGRWGRERAAQRQQVGVGLHRREGRHGRTGLDAATLLFAGEPGFGFASGEVWGVHTAWSGNHVHQLERDLGGRQLLGGGELLLPGEIVLEPGDRYTSPWVYGVHGNGLDEAARRVHRLLRARRQHPRSPRPVTLNTWEAVYFDHDFDVLAELAELAASVGVERFVLDDGWFGGRRNDRAGLGDWTVSSEVWPDGLHPLVDRVRGLGMQFGLWVEPEMVNPDSELARSHPEWIMSARDGWPVESRHQQVLDLAHPGCYAHIRDALVALLDEYDISYLKWDHNRDLVDAGSGPGRRPGVHRQTAAFYRLVDELKARYPHLEIESCSSGGGRVDLGALERTDRVWVSDNNDPLDRGDINRWTTQLVPPELMGTHIASARSHTTGRTHSLSYRAITALFGHLGIETDLRRADDAELAELADWVALHRRHRELLHDGDLVRLDHPDTSLALEGVVAHDRSRALYAYSSRARSPLAGAGRIRLPGLAPHRDYRVEPVRLGEQPDAGDRPAWWDSGRLVLTGAALGSAGVAMPALHPEQAVLLEVTAVDAEVFADLPGGDQGTS